jgi:membrane protein
VIRSFRGALAGFVAHQGFFLAAGVSFFFLICLVPLLFLIVAIAGFVLSSEAAAQAVLNHLSGLVPVYRKELKEVLLQIIAARGLSGILGTIILLFFSTQLFAALRFVTNVIFGVKQGHGWMRGTLYDMVMVFLMGGLFLASVALTDLLEWLRIFIMAPAGVPRAWSRAMSIALGLAFSMGLFFVTYRYFPNRKVPVLPALAGAVLASALWETAKQLFRWYIVSLGVYDQIYGALGVLVALSMFAYYTGIVFILGAEYAAALEETLPPRS